MIPSIISRHCAAPSRTPAPTIFRETASRSPSNPAAAKVKYKKNVDIHAPIPAGLGIYIFPVYSGKDNIYI